MSIDRSREISANVPAIFAALFGTWKAGAAWVPCDPAAPHCGDGTCSALENCRLCPIDCTACDAICGDGYCDTGETAAISASGLRSADQTLVVSAAGAFKPLSGQITAGEVSEQ